MPRIFDFGGREVERSQTIMAFGRWERPKSRTL